MAGLWEDIDASDDGTGAGLPGVKGSSDALVEVRGMQTWDESVLEGRIRETNRARAVPLHGVLIGVVSELTRNLHHPRRRRIQVRGAVELWLGVV